MPDWSYHLLFKPILSFFPRNYSREFIHRGMNNIASLPGGHHIINFLGREESSRLLHKEIQGISYSNSIGLSGKIDPLLSGSRAFSNLGFGFMEIGPVTLAPTLNPSFPVVDSKNEIIVFPENCESIGLEKTLRKLKKWKSKQPVMIRLAGSDVEQLELMAELEMYADAFISDSYTLTLSQNITKIPVYFAVPVDQLQEISIDSIEKGFSGIVLDEIISKTYFTTLLDTISFLKKEGYSKPILTVGGISEPEDALQLLDAGADLVMLSGGYVFSGPGLTKRIKEALLFKLQPRYPLENVWIWYWLFGLAIFIGGLLATIFGLTTIILPYDEHFLGMKKETILLFNERILWFMAHDRMTLAGTMISGGIVYMTLARFGVRYGLLWAKQAIDSAAIVGFLGIFMFIGYGYFDWLHLVFWLILLPIYGIGLYKTKHIRGTPISRNTKNHAIWKRSLIGQLAFVILGFSFVLGGIVISSIGVTNVFVPTDILYICMPPEMLDSFNNKLIPVIAHDRAGFGSALLSVGLLVLMISLWAFQQGNKWVWWTLLIGGIPAFLAGISVHFAIGYTSSIHLLPAYFALSLFILGLSTTYHFFHMKH
ncbi:dihydroorotate dehydrogenase [Fredinandcohnia humi]